MDMKLRPVVSVHAIKAAQRLDLRKKIEQGTDFISRQKSTFKINLFRASSQNFFLNLTQQYQPLLITALGAGPFLLGLLNSVGGFIGSLVALPAGLLADKYGIRKILLLATPIITFGALLFASATNLSLVLLAVVTVSFARSMLDTVCPMVCGSCLKNNERATGMQLCDTISALPSLLAPIIGAFIIASFGGISIEGIRPLYYLQSLGLLLIFIFVYKSFRNPATQKVFTAPLRFIKGLRDVFGRGMAVKRWILFRSLSSIPLFVGAIYIPLYAAERKGADQFVLGAMATTSLLPPILLSVVMGKMADTIGRKKVIYFVTPFYCLSLILLIYASDQTMLLLSGILQGFLMLSYVTEGAMTAELVPVGLLGRWYGVLGLFRGMISVLAPVTAGIVWSIANPESVFIFLVVTQLLKMVILLRMPETLRT